MAASPFHLGWFVDNFRTPSWNTVWSGSGETDWMNGDFYVDVARSLERAKFDFMLIADSAYIDDQYRGSMETSLKYGANAPKNDPSALAILLAQATRHLGFLPTLSTSEWNPYQLARFVATADHLSSGRMGWNVVTGGNVKAAQNYGVDEPASHDDRYDIADEFVDIACQLWDSWEPDAIVMDRERGYYADHNKVHAINYEGKYFKSKGPLTSSRSPQGRPVLSQAGASPRGRQFAAKHADVVMGTAGSIEGMRAYRDDVRAQMAGAGRDPDSCKVVFNVSPVLADTDQEAQERARLQNIGSEASLEIELAAASRHFMIDFAQFDLNNPLPAGLTTNGHQGTLAAMIASGKPLRELMDGGPPPSGPLAFVGSPDTVAAKMGEVMAEIGGDGFYFVNMSLTRHYVTMITDGLVPALQLRGLTRTDYDHTHFRENLLAF